MRGLLLMSALVPTLAFAGTASAQSTIQPGQTVQGAFSSKDPTLDDGSHHRCYVIQTAADQAYTVEMRSDDFDAFLAIGEGSDCDTATLFNDDGPDMGTNAQLRFRSNGGQWFIRANTLGANETGRYSLSVSRGQQVTPTMEILDIDIGETVRGELTFSDRVAEDGSFYDCLRLNVPRAMTVNIAMNSSVFDSYLSLYQGGRCTGASLFADDDSGGDLNALISERLEAGVYSIRANTLSANEEGAYSVSVTTSR